MAETLPPSRDHAAIARNLAYATYPDRHLQLLLDLFRPDVPYPVPVVLWLHDGGWRSGSKDHCPIRWLVRYGFAVATASYRLLPHDHYPAQIHDAKAAVRFLRGHANEFDLKPNAIAACGASTGAYLANMLGTTAGLAHFDQTEAAHRPLPTDHDMLDANVQAVVNYYGFTDFPALQTLPTRRQKTGLASPEARFLNASPRDQPELAAQASPITHVRPGLPPFLHLHGETNRVVPLDQSRRFHDKLREHHNDSKLVLLKRVGHAGSTIFNLETARYRVIDFLNDQLGRPGAEFKAD